VRVGDILLREKWVEWESLVTALDDQRGTDVRIVSLLVARKLITFDQGSLALGEQHGVHALLRRHLDARDQTLIQLVPIDLVRLHAALPIGRMGDDTLIVAVRDPSMDLEAELAAAIGEAIVLAVAPAAELELAAIEALQRRAADDVPIDLDPGSSGEVDVDLDASSSGELDVAIEVGKPMLASKPLPVAIKKTAAVTKAAAPDSIEAVIAALPDIDDVSWLLDAVSKVLAKHWVAAVLRPAIDLPAGSLLALACERRRVIHDVPPKPVDAPLVAELKFPAQPVIAPIVRGDTVPYVIAVGEPRRGDPEDAAADLAMLAEAIGERLTTMGDH
jgi:hypothetical protein